MRLATSALMLLPLLACADPAYQGPAFTPAQQSAAMAEISGGQAPVRRAMTDEQAQQAIARVARRLAPAGTSACQELRRTCNWRFIYDPSQELNAAATGEGDIIIQRGVAEYARNDDEMAFVIAHEMAHHAANHVQNTTTRAQIGGVLAGVLASLAGAYAGVSPDGLVQGAAGIGSQLAVISYSKAQEREADAIGATIMHRAGYDVAQGRSMLLALARLSGRLETSLLSTHPAGPDRVASFDAAVADMKRANWRLGAAPGG
ncbi:M48 family metalloprotease [Teichococcus oryzae]|uniref:M48 family metalloprotease n=1 Tax=Teichococcus oryzae TaxID=1608942 RepID=A0A5B2TLQ1_9PROT|nr:M48 family metalloprotease [Pseudoroseomonas oryzae]KAA2214690.1 M48 family metalloprotease [Pseudoroseomonas oryzae]